MKWSGETSTPATLSGSSSDLLEGQRPDVDDRVAAVDGESLRRSRTPHRRRGARRWFLRSPRVSSACAAARRPWRPCRRPRGRSRSARSASPSAVGHRRPHPTRAEAVRANAGRPVVDGDALRQHRESRLRRAVGEALRRCAKAGDGRDADDRTTPLEKMRDRGPGGQEGARDIGPKHLLESVGVEVEEVAVTADPGVEDERVEAAEAFDRLRTARSASTAEPVSATIASPSTSAAISSMGPRRRPVTATA